MKKLLCALMTFVLALGCLNAALADDPDWNPIGSGKHNVKVLIKVLDRYVYGYDLSSDEENLLDALQDVELVEGEKASWGYNVTIVDGYRGIPEENGAYWNLLTYNDEHQRFQKASESIDQIRMDDYNAIAFVRNSDDVPYEEKLIYVAVQAADELYSYEILTGGQETVLDCLLDNGVVAGEMESWGFNVTEAGGVRADYDRDGSYWNILVFDESQDEFVYMDEALANIRIDDLPSIPAMAGYAFILTK